jgi:hypothetical protein
MVVREKVQLAKWLASKLIPIYGDKQEIKQDTNITIQWNNPDNNVVDVTPIHALAKANPDKSYNELDKKLNSK